MTNERSESPTPRRRRLAREQGQVARSYELAAALGYLAAVGALAVCGPGLLRLMMHLLRSQLRTASSADHGTASHAASMQQVGYQMILHLLPLLGLICAAVLLAHWAQTGLLWLPHKLLPNLRHVDPMRGFQRLVSPAPAGRLLFQTAKVALLVVAAGTVMRHQLPEILHLGAYDIAALLQHAWRLMSRLALVVGAAMLLFGVLDYATQRWKHEQQLRMTPEQLREEVKSIRGLGAGPAETRDND